MSGRGKKRQAQRRQRRHLLLTTMALQGWYPLKHKVQGIVGLCNGELMATYFPRGNGSFSRPLIEITPYFKSESSRWVETDEWHNHKGAVLHAIRSSLIQHGLLPRNNGEVISVRVQGREVMVHAKGVL